MKTLKGHLVKTASMTFSPDSTVLASAGYFDRTVKLWDVSSGQLIRTVKSDTYYGFNSVVFSPDSKTLAASGSYFGQGTIKLWDVVSGKELNSLKGETAALSFSPDSTVLASAGKQIELWDVKSGQVLKTLKGHASSVKLMVFSSDGKTLVSGSEDNTIRLWNVSSGQEINSFSKDGPTTFLEVSKVTPEFYRNNSVYRVSPNERFQIELGENGRLNLSEAKTSRLLASLITLDENDWFVIAPDGLFDGSSASWTKIIWRFNNNTFNYSPVEVFFNDFYYPGLLPDLVAGKRPKAPSDIAQKDRRQPKLKLTAQTGSNLRSRNMKVRVDVAEVAADKDHKTGSGARDVRLFRNGSLVKVWRGDVLKGQTQVTLEATVPIVAGANSLSAYAFNHDNIKSSDATLTINGADSLKRSGTAYILAIGINTYANSEYNLKYAVADAQDFASEVKHQQEILKRYARVDVTSLIDAEATRANIIQKLLQLANRVQPEDVVIVYFAGHGTKNGNQFYLIPHDLGHRGPRTRLSARSLQTILAHSISDRDMERAFEGIDAGQPLLVIDACNSGQALEAEEKRRGPMNSKGLAQLAYEKGMYVLTAAQSYQAAQEAAKFGHGFLTYALVEEGLKQGRADREPKDGTINLREWLNYATDAVPRMQDQNILDALRGRGRYLNFAGDGSGPKDPKSNVQRPRIFFRRELESSPLVIAVLGSARPQ